MITRADALADTVALTVNEPATARVATHDPHDAVTVNRAVLAPYEAPTRALDLPSSTDLLATTVWSPTTAVCQATEVIERSPAASPRGRRTSAALLASCVIALAAAAAAMTVGTESKSSARPASDRAAMATTTQRVAPARPFAAPPVPLSAADRVDLERLAVDAVMSGEPSTARAHYQALAAGTDDEAFDRIVVVLGRTP